MEEGDKWPWVTLIATELSTSQQECGKWENNKVYSRSDVTAASRRRLQIYNVQKGVVVRWVNGFNMLCILLLSLLSLVTSVAVGCDFPTPPIVIDPEGTVTIEDKAPLKLTCTILPEHRNKLNSSDIFLKKNGNTYDAAHGYIKVPNNYQMVLDIPKAEVDHFRGHIACTHPATVPCLWFNSGYSVDVVFRRDPIVPHFTSCIVQNWESLQCTWLPTHKDQLKHTLTTRNSHNFTYEFIYTPLSLNGTLGHQKRCWMCKAGSPVCDPTVSLNETCVLHTNSSINTFTMGGLYYLDIHARTDNNDQSTMSWFQQFSQHFNSSDFVKPNPVEKMKMDNLTNIVSWERPVSSWSDASSWQLVYNISYSNQWQDGSESILTTNNTLHLTWPYTIYQVNVTVKPINSGYFSEVTSLSFTTPPVAPTVNPETSVLGYEYGEKCSVDCRATIRWKPISASQQNGPDFEYVVLSRPLTSRTRRRALKDNKIDKTTSSDLTDDWVRINTPIVVGFSQSTIEIDVTHGAEITLVSRNSEGEMQITGQPIRVMEKRNVLDVRELLIIEGHREDLSMVTASIDLPTPGALYVLFWKPKTPSVSGHVIDWMDMLEGNGTISVRIVVDGAYTGYVYGLGKLLDGVTSGIHWSQQPLYSYNGLGSPPSKISEVLSTSSSVTLQWDISSHQGQGYVTHYDVRFCAWDKEKATCKEEHFRSMVVLGREKEMKLTNLDHSTDYIVNMTSVTRAGKSQTITVIVSTKFGLGTAAVGGIVAGGLIILVLITLGIYTLCKKCHKARTWYNTGLKIEIPEGHRLGGESISSATPFLHQNDDPYNRSISINSVDSGFSLEDTYNQQDEINGYARGGYGSSPLPSIPEDGVDDVFSRDGRFVEMYQVRCQNHNGYLSNQTSENSLDRSRVGISKYAAVAIDGQREMESGNKYNSVTFSPGDEKVQITSNDQPSGNRTPSPDSTCTYTQIQTDHDTKEPDVFKKAFFNANRTPVMPGYISHNDIPEHPKTRKSIPRHRQRHASYPVKLDLNNKSSGYVPNDGSFNPKYKPVVAMGYVANDKFEPAIEASARKPALLSNGYLPNDVDFKNPEIQMNGHIGEKTTGRDSLQNYLHHAANDSTLKSNAPKTTPVVTGEYVAHDGLCVAKAISSNPRADVLDSEHSLGYVANDGSFDVSLINGKPRPDDGKHSIGYVPFAEISNPRGRFSEKGKHSVPSGYIANNGSLNSMAKTPEIVYVPNDRNLANSSRSDSVSDEVGCNLEAVLNPNYVPKDTFGLPEVDLSHDNGQKTGGSVLLKDNASGYVAHDWMASSDSLNRRLSAIEYIAECDLQQKHCDRRRNEIPSFETADTGNLLRNKSSHSLSDLQECSKKTFSSGCTSANDDCYSQEADQWNSLVNFQNSLILSPEHLTVHPSLREHRKSAPCYVNIKPNTANQMDCTVPSSIACSSRLSGGFVKLAEPESKTSVDSSAQPEKLIQNCESGKWNNPTNIPVDSNGYIPHDHSHTKEQSSDNVGMNAGDRIKTHDHQNNLRNCDPVEAKNSPQCNGYVKHEDTLNDNTPYSQKTTLGNAYLPNDVLQNGILLNKPDNNNMTVCRPNVKTVDNGGYIHMPLLSNSS